MVRNTLTKGGHYVPVFVIADLASGRPEQYLTAGFDGYLARPFHVGELTEAIRRFLRARIF